MARLGKLIWIWGMVVAAYLILLVTHGVVIDLANTANTTMAASSNMTNYPGAAATMVVIPWVLFFVPGVVGIAATVLVLLRK